MSFLHRGEVHVSLSRCDATLPCVRMRDSLDDMLSPNHAPLVHVERQTPLLLASSSLLCSHARTRLGESTFLLELRDI
jgi:hypothetical protein